MSASRLSGGCQCGAVRYAIAEPPRVVAICHCRMCQKATGSIVWPYFTVARSAFSMTRGALSHFRSSAMALRGFCSACGTPISFEADGEETLDLGIGTLDHPEPLVPTEQYWVSARMLWFGDMAGLPVAGLGDRLPADEVARRRPFQHPDHDTAAWPDGGAGG